MNSLLKRQIRKYLGSDLANDEQLEKFLDSVDRSYNNFEDQSTMIQRAMSISSDELFEANKQLKEEAKEQKEVIDKLKNVINTLKFYDLTEDKQTDELELSGSNLVDFIDSQTKNIVEINKQKELLLKELEHQNQELSDYAHMVSHDLKSPLRSIETLTTWLKEDFEDKLGDAGKENLTHIKSNVQKMDTLISGILEYSTIGKTHLEIYDVDSGLLINDILNIIHVPEHVLVKKNLNLPIVKGDKYRLQQLFQNLIVNAVKYNDKEKGIIEIGAEEKGDFWQFHVKDNGKGIDKIYFEKIFKTFEKLENSPNATGIGLSIVKKIIDLYGGKVWLTSKINKGTTFYFTLKKDPNGAT